MGTEINRTISLRRSRFRQRGAQSAGLHSFPYSWLAILAILTAGHDLSAKEPASSATHPSEPVVVQLKWYHQFQFAGYYAAIHKGLYENEGLQVRLVEGTPGVDPVDKVLSGEADYGVGTPALLIQRNQGRPVVVLAAIFQHSPTVLLTRRDSGIATPQDLRGRKVMLGTPPEPEVTAMLLNEGVRLEDVVVLPHSWRLEDLIEKKVDALTGYLTNEPFVLQDQGVPTVVMRPVTYGIDFYGDCLFTSEKEVDSHPERVKAFLRATRRGWQYATDHPEEIADVILTHYGKRHSREHLLREAKAMRELTLPYIVLGRMNPGRWRGIGDTYVKLGMLKPDYSLEGFLHSELKKSEHATLHRFLNAAAVVIALAVLVILALAVFNRQLRKAVRTHAANLAHSESRYRSLYTHMVEAVALHTLVCDETGRPINYRITDVNAQYEAISNLSRQQVVGKLATEAYGLAEPPCLAEFSAVAQTGQSQRFEFHFPPLDRYFDVSVVSWEKGQFATLFSDITHRKHTEEELKSRIAEISTLHSLGQRISAILSPDELAQAALAGVIDTIQPDLVMLFLRQGENLVLQGVRSSDPQFEHQATPVHRVGECLCGLAVQQGQALYALDIRSDPRCTWEECKKAGLISFAALPLRHADQIIGVLALGSATQPHDFSKQAAFLETLASAVAIGLRNALLHAEVAQHGVDLARANEDLRAEIAERRRAEEALRQERDKIQNYLDIAGVIILVVAADQTVTLINRRGCEVLGCAPDEIVGKNWFESFVPAHTRGAVQDLFRELMLGETPVPTDYYENPILTGSGEQRMIGWRSTLVKDPAGRIIGTLSSGEDITDRKRADEERLALQEQLHQAQKLEALGRLAGGIAHDFGNLVTVVLGNAGIMRRKLPTGTGTEESLTMIEQAAQEASTVARSLLLFSRNLPTARKPMNLVAWTAQSLSLLRRLLPASIELIEAGPAPPAVWIRADATQIQQVLFNLVINARDAMPQGGKLSVSVRQAAASDLGEGVRELGPAQAFAVLEVSDAGCGIPPEIQSRIFEPLFTTKEGGKGTGLGLAIARSIIKDHGGRIDVHSQVNVGTRFTVVLPCVEPAGERVSAASEAGPTGKNGGRVLLAVGNQQVREILTLTLRSQGYEVTQAADSEALMEAFRKYEGGFKLLLLDVDIAQRSGIDCLRELRASGCQIPAILIASGEEDGGDDELPDNTLMLRKPFAVAQLARQVSQIVARGRVESSEEP